MLERLSGKYVYPDTSPVRHQSRFAFFVADAVVLTACFLLTPFLAGSTVQSWITSGMWPGISWVAGILLLMNLILPRKRPRTLFRQVVASAVYAGTIFLAVTLIALPPLTGPGWTLWILTYITVVVWQVVRSYVRNEQRATLRLAAVPFGLLGDGLSLNGIELVPLSDVHIPRGVDGLVVDSNAELPKEWAAFVTKMAARGTTVYDAATLYETAAYRIPIAHVTFALERIENPYRVLKRGMDVLAVIVTLPITVPVSIVVATAIALDSPGPVIFRQDRIGEGGKVFSMLKFRSMRNEDSDAPKFATEEEHRITRVGRVLRHFRLDELPQLWNVLVGDMSLIGPRPEQVAFARQFEEAIPYYMSRHLVKPGITGLAQVEQGYASGVEETWEKLEYDLYYVKHYSLWLDLLIVIRTVGVVLHGIGAR